MDWITACDSMKSFILMWLCFASSLSSEGLFGSSGVLRKFIAEHHLDDRHVGVGFDPVRGVATNTKIFLSTTVDVDPLSAKARISVSELLHHRDVFQIRAREMHCSFMRGMFVRDIGLSQLFSEPVRGSSVMFGTRSDVMLLIKLRASEVVGRVSPAVSTALSNLPDSFNASDTSSWDAFFSVFPTHFSDIALVGSKLTASVLLPESMARQVDVKGVLDTLIRTGSKEKAELLARMGAKDRILVQGGQTSLLEGSLRSWNEQSYNVWQESVKLAPTVIGHHIRPISDLVIDPNRKAALLAAIEHHIHKAYEIWRAERLQHDEISKLLVKSRIGVHAEVEELEKYREGVKEKLLKQQAVIQSCEDEIDRISVQTQRCRDEIKAFSKALLECDARNLNNEHAQSDLATCEAKKRLLGCK